MERLVIENRSLPLWLRTTFVDENGQVFFPCGALGDERTAMLCATHDGVAVVRDGGHLYAPVSWLEKQHPRFRDQIRTIAECITRRLDAAGPDAVVA